MFKALAAAALAFLATGCLFSPGQFDAAMTVRKDGSFTYRYVGEIQFLNSLSAMNAAAKEEAEDVFKPEDEICWKDTKEGEDAEMRDCTEKELSDKRKQWEERATKKQRENEMMKTMLGGIDPSDPATMDAFARRLQGNAGWKSVTHKGNGVFAVDYEVAGRLDRDFIFPVFEGVDFIVPFVQLVRRADGKVHVTAPAFINTEQGPLSGSALGAAAMGGGRSDKPDGFKRPQGTFTLTTDAEILTNNTENGPVQSGASRILKWVVGPLERNKPEALLRL